MSNLTDTLRTAAVQTRLRKQAQLQALKDNPQVLKPLLGALSSSTKSGASQAPPASSDPVEEQRLQSTAAKEISLELGEEGINLTPEQVESMIP